MAKKIFLCALMILCFSGMAFAVEDSEITFKGNLTIIQDGKKIRVTNTKKIPIPKVEQFGTQDDHPTVMAEMFEREGFTKAKPVITVKTSKPFTLSCNRVKGVYYIGNDYVRFEDWVSDEKQTQLLRVGGEKSPFEIPAVKRDYYVEVEMTEKELDELLKEQGVEGEDGELFLDAAVLQYFKMRVTK
ncbi:MAG: hypothetical protein IJQ99_01685 [Synergistaceae bacterium]|nr:hypothetical protein [Synergistaceae bacterium]